MALLLAVDPSINTLGWAIFDIPAKHLYASGTLKTDKAARQKSLQERIANTIRELKEIIEADLPDIESVVIEEPQQWGAYKSVASQHAGSLMGLYLTVGTLFGVFYELDKEVSLVKVSQWKGNLPKHLTIKRVNQRFDTQLTMADNNEADAIGIGAFWLDHLKRDDLGLIKGD